MTVEDKVVVLAVVNVVCNVAVLVETSETVVVSVLMLVARRVVTFVMVAVVGENDRDAVGLELEVETVWLEVAAEDSPVELVGRTRLLPM